jgi:uncharacterized protein (TIGR02996 family)
VTTLESLLSGLPDDPLTAFVVADYLEEQGDPRAEVLRLVCTLTRSVKVRGRAGLEKRLRMLLYEHKIPPVAATMRLPLSETVGLTLAWIPPGTFRMGSPRSEANASDAEQPTHNVTLTRGFWVGVYLVTQAEWRAVLGDNPSQANQGDRFPVDNVSWNDAKSFCEQASRQTGRHVRLPSEAEWEYACRAGTSTAFHFGNAINHLANYETRDGEESGTTEVGSFPPNGFGLYDCHGNLYEWVNDRYSRSYYQSSPAIDPPGPEGDEGDHRLLRGGSWYYGWSHCRSAYRIECSVNYGHFDQGFRVVCEHPR